MNCAFCLATGLLEPRQVLTRGRSLYVCAPRGPIVEGFLAIAPLRCVDCIARFPADYFDELDELIDLVRTFYRRAYACEAITLYEQGRGGGPFAAHPEFPLHAHLCSVPLDLDLHRLLERSYVRHEVQGPRDLRRFGDQGPYLYVEACGSKSAYVGATPSTRQALRQSQLRREVASLAGRPERGHWRDCTEDRELDSLLKQWRFHDGIQTDDAATQSTRIPTQR